MRIFFPVLFASLFSAVVLADTPGEVKAGAQLRDTPLHSFTGKDKKFSDFKGKPLIINVWASWCGPCRSEMGSLERLARRYGGKQFNVIGISTDDDRDAAAAFIRKSGITFENFLDSHLVLENMLGADTIPLTLLVDANGRVLEKVHGAYAWDSPEIVDAIGETFGIRLKR
jgi:thiol-disulfide isomerase/thioredoxin